MGFVNNIFILILPVYKLSSLIYFSINNTIYLILKQTVFIIFYLLVSVSPAILPSLLWQFLEFSLTIACGYTVRP
jgi:hypothetical protein